jgi:NADPH-dependent 2,4-dienoyl-CoA reductase/sulfur reductase-like enzyme/nitrite reductase/ring-hydroxylating ferredoxin subunit
LTVPATFAHSTVMSAETKPTGPDLALGVPAADLADGGMLLGHAQGEAVLLARRGATVFAVGATCTHYGGPLVEGLVVGEEVRCPWHHACFSLVTGEATRAPALNAVACFDVTSRDEKLYVLGRRDVATVRLAGFGPASVVIVGAGAAGNACAEALRRERYAGPITLLGAEATGPVDRPNLSKDYLAGTAPEEWMALRGDDFYREHDIELVTGTRVTAIDLGRKQVKVDGQASRTYGALVLATGAEPVRLSIPGADDPHVFVLRTLADSRAIIAKAAASKRVVILGASFIGLETAASLRARGLDVHVVSPEAIPLARILGDAIGNAVKKLHEDHGVQFHLGTSASAIELDAVRLVNGDRVATDMVVAGVGVRPQVALAEEAGLTVNRGIVVDEGLRTSAADVWAIGDAARWPDPRSGLSIRVEHWVVAERMGQIAAKSVLGATVRCDLVPFFWSAHYDMTINYVGHAERWDRIDMTGDLDVRDAAVAFRSDGRTLAVATVGRDHAALEAEAAIERGDESALRKIVP